MGARPPENLLKTCRILYVLAAQAPGATTRAATIRNTATLAMNQDFSCRMELHSSSRDCQLSQRTIEGGHRASGRTVSSTRDRRLWGARRRDVIEANSLPPFV